MLTILDILYVTINITVCVTIDSMLLFIAQALVYSTNFDLNYMELRHILLLVYIRMDI